MKKSIKKIIASVVAGAMALAMMVTPNVDAVAADGAGDLILHAKIDAADWGNETSLHMWGAGTTETTWPGHAVLADSSNSGWYTFEIAITDAVNFIFNNKGNGKQTANIEGVVAGEYWYTIADSEAGIVFTVTTTAPEGWVVPQKTNAEKFAEKVAAIGEVTLNSEAAIKSAEDAYAALTDAEKATVAEAYATLTAARTAYDALKKAEDEKNAAAAGELTLYVKAPATWTQVSLWAWTANGNLFKEWPGQAMTACEKNAGYWKATISVDGVTSVIFNDSAENNKQTIDIVDLAAGTYWFDLTEIAEGDNAGKFEGTASTTAPTGWQDEAKAEIETQPTTEATTPAAGEDETEAEEEDDTSAWDDALLKIHFLNSMEWDTVGVFLTYGSWANLTGAWPGAEMQLEDGSETWYAVCTNKDAEETYNVIFNNMVSDAQADAGEAVKEQTGDITGLAAGEYWFVLGEVSEESDKQIKYAHTMFDSVEALEEAGYEYDGNGLVDFEEEEEEEEETEEETTTAETADGADTGDVAPIAVVLLGMVAVVAVVASKKRQNA